MTKKVAILGGVPMSLMGDKFHREVKTMLESGQGNIMIIDSLGGQNVQVSYQTPFEIANTASDSIEMEQLDQRRMVKTDRNNLSYYPKSHRKFPVKR